MGKTQHTGMSTWDNHIKHWENKMQTGILHPTPENQNLFQKNPNTWTTPPEKRPRVSPDPTTSTRRWSCL